MVSFQKLALCASLAVAAVTTATADARVRVGTEEHYDFAVPAGASRQDVISYPGASYVAVHFGGFNLPEGDAVVVRTPDSAVSYEYTGRGRNDLGSFYATYIPGSKAIVEYISSGVEAAGDYAYKIDGFARGFPASMHESVCGADNSMPAKCYLNGTETKTLPFAYQRAQTVARLLINGSFFCTGWLAGSEGHLMTNHHCIDDPALAGLVDIEFEAESSSCTKQCRWELGCRGKVVTNTTTFITNNEEHDYALLQLPQTAEIRKYGYLQLREDGPKLGEDIYIPQHPSGWAKRIAAKTEYVDRNGVTQMVNASIQTLHGETGCGKNQVGYAADTMGGSSGSPVLAQFDNNVVALHHCGGCENTAVDIRDVIADLRAKNINVKDLIVPSATQAPTPTPTTVAPTPAPTPVPTHKPDVWCNRFHKKWTCVGWLWCGWDAQQNVCYKK